MDTISVTNPEFCAYCGGSLALGRASTGRPRVYCSDNCRKAAWDERRKRGAVAVQVKVVERVVVKEHNLAECSRRCCVSPVAATNMLYALLKRLEVGELKRQVGAPMDRPANTDRHRVHQKRRAAMTPLLDIEAAAAYLNISRRSLADHIRAGRIRHARIGKHIRIRPEWLDEYVTTCERPVVTIPIQRGRRRALL